MKTNITRKSVEVQTVCDTALYKSMTPYLACAYAEGFCEGEGADEDDVLVAWQYIKDTGLWRSLQGFYGRAVHALIEDGRLI